MMSTDNQVHEERFCVNEVILRTVRLDDGDIEDWKSYNYGVLVQFKNFNNNNIDGLYIPLYEKNDNVDGDYVDDMLECLKFARHEYKKQTICIIKSEGVLDKHIGILVFNPDNEILLSGSQIIKYRKTSTPTATPSPNVKQKEKL